MMFGCLRKLGCLFVLLLAALAYALRGYWWEPARAIVERKAGVATVTDTVSRWERLTPAAAERGERQVRALAAPRGPVYVTLRAGDLASYAFLSLANTLPASAENAEAIVIDDRVYVRSVVPLRQLAGAVAALGPVSRLLGERDTLTLGGTFDVLEPGRAQFRVQDVRLGRYPIPAKAIPALLSRVRRGERGPGVDVHALEVPIPSYIGDVRIARGRITLYKRR